MDNQSSHRWLTLALTTINCALDFGVLFVFGLFFVPMLDKFKEDRPTTALVQSILVGITLSFGVVSGWLVSRFGVRNVSLVGAILVPLGFTASFFVTSILYIVVCIGVIAGIGISMIHVSSITSTGRLFQGSQKPIALTIVVAGTSVSGLIYPYFIQWLMDKYGLNGTFLILGGIYLHSITMPLLYSYESQLQVILSRSLNKSENVINTEECRSIAIQHVEITKPRFKRTTFNMIFVDSLLLTKQYIFLLLATSLAMSALNGFVVVIVDVFLWKGLTRIDGTFAFIPFNVANFVGRLLPGLVTQLKLNPFVLAICLCLSSVVGQVLLYVTFDYYALLAGCALAGLNVGGLMASMAILLVDIVGELQLSIGFGLIITINGLLSSATGPLCGYIRDSTASYSTVFVFVAVSQCIGALLFLVLALMREKSTNNSKSKTRAQSIYTITKL